MLKFHGYPSTPPDTLGNFFSDPRLSSNFGLKTKVILDSISSGLPFMVSPPPWREAVLWTVSQAQALPEDSKLPLLPLMIFPLLPMLASFEVFSVPVSVRSMAISLRLRAAWILDWKGKVNRLWKEQKVPASL